MENAPNDALARGARLFDAGAYFEAHEAWEALWRVEADEPRRRFLQGLIQVAAALHKLVVVGAVEPARSLFAKALAKLDACPAAFDGVDVAALRAHIRDLAASPTVAPGRVPRIEWVGEDHSPRA